MRRDLTLLGLVCALACVGCGDDHDEPAPDAAVPDDGATQGDGQVEEDAAALEDAAPPDAGLDFDPTAPETSVLLDGVVRREPFTVEGVTPPPNPETGASTPSELNATTLVRYSVEGEDEPTAIVIGLPGLWGGAGTLDAISRALVKRSADAGTPIEVWAMDRRANAFEDLRGMHAALAQARPEIAERYYDGSATIGGERFAGFVRAQDVTYASEWGLETHVGDLRRVIERIPEAQRRGRVFLMGHSLGAIIARAYAAWRFEDGDNGTDELAGIILVDGAPFYDELEESDYHGGPPNGIGGTPLTVPGLDAIRGRDSALHTAIPTTLLAQLQTFAIRALLSPEVVETVPGRESILKLQLGLDSDSLPRMTNRAGFGFFMDDGSNPLYIAAASLGEPDGATETAPNALLGGTIQRPSDPEHVYDWISADDSGEATRLEDFAGSQFVSGTNLTEWYFPSRLLLDCIAVAAPVIPEDGYQAAAGLRPFDQDRIDAPVLAIATEVSNEALYDNVKGAIAANVGADRPNAGASRDEATGFSVVSVPRFTHMDPVTAHDSAENPIPRAIFEFVTDNSAD